MKPTSQIEESVSYALAKAGKAHRGCTDAALRQVGLHVGQEMILIQLWHQEGLTQSQLVDELCVEPPTITKMLQRMEADGLVERRPDAQDARISRVFLTPLGRAKQPEVEACWQQVEAQTTTGLTLEERLLLRRLLQQVRRNLGE